MFVAERRAQALRVARLRDVTVGRHAQGLLLDAFAAAAQYRPFPRIDEAREPALENLIHHFAQRTLDSAYGNSAMTSICTRNPESTRRCTCTHEVVGNRSLL